MIAQFLEKPRSTVKTYDPQARWCRGSVFTIFGDDIFILGTVSSFSALYDVIHAAEGESENIYDIPQNLRWAQNRQKL